MITWRRLTSGDFPLLARWLAAPHVAHRTSRAGGTTTPRRRPSNASGVTRGLTVSIGGVTSPLIGALADHTALRMALTPLVVLPALS